MPVVNFVNEFRRVEVPAGTNLREVALGAGVSIDRQHFLGLSCKNRGLCGQCKVWVRDKSSGATSRRTWKETLLFFRRLSGWSRLACQVRVQGDVDVWTVAGGPDRLATDRPIDAPPTPTAHAKPVVEPPKPAEAPPKAAAAPPKAAADAGKSVADAPKPAADAATPAADAPKQDATQKPGTAEPTAQ